MAGLLAIMFLMSAIVMLGDLFSSQERQFSFLSIAFLVSLFVVAAYLIYSTYLGWFHLSPKAVRHICGSLGFVIYLVLLNLTETLFGASSPIYGLATIVGLIGVYFAYKACSVKLIRLLFQEDLTSGSKGQRDHRPKARALVS